MKLQEQMDALTKSFVAQAPEQALEIMVHSSEKLRDSGIAGRALKVGDKAPDFSLRNTSDTEAGLSGLLANGPLVLSFFRGKW